MYKFGLINSNYEIHLLYSVNYLDASRTLCIHSNHFDMDEKHFEIRIATSSGKAVYFELEVLKEDAMKIG